MAWMEVAGISLYVRIYAAVSTNCVLIPVQKMIYSIGKHTQNFFFPSLPPVLIFNFIMLLPIAHKAITAIMDQ